MRIITTLFSILAIQVDGNDEIPTSTERILKRNEELYSFFDGTNPGLQAGMSPGLTSEAMLIQQLHCLIKNRTWLGATLCGNKWSKHCLSL